MNINIVSFPDIIHDESRKFLFIDPKNKDLQTFVDTVSIIDDLKNYTIYNWSVYHDEKNNPWKGDAEWMLNAASQSEFIYINLENDINSFVPKFLFGWEKTYWTSHKDDVDFFMKMNKNHILTPIDLLLNI